MRHPRQVLSRTKIFECVWGYDFGPASNSLEVYVGYLRRKTEAGGEPRLVHTVRGVGYVLRCIVAMSFRRRMVLLAAGAVAAAIVIASVVVYVVTGNELRGQIDASLRQKLTPGAAGGPDPLHERLRGRCREADAGRQAAARGVAGDRLRRVGGANWPVRRAGPARRRGVRPRAKAVAGVSHRGNGLRSKANLRSLAPGETLLREAASRAARAVRSCQPARAAPLRGSAARPGTCSCSSPTGRFCAPEAKGSLLPVTAATRAVAAGRRGAFFSDATVAGTPVRILTERAPEGGVWQVALPLTDVDSTLTHLKLVLALVCLGGIALAAALGLLVSRAALCPCGA